jgi:hypothetical protein
MRKAILIALFPLILGAVIVDLSAQTKRKTKKHKPDPYLAPLVSPCGVPVPRYDEYLEELKVEWRDVGENAQTTWYYNTHKQVCEKGILKAWTKSVEKDTTKPLAYSIDKIELNCRSNQTRLMVTVKYQKDGSVIDSFTVPEPKWLDVFPDSVGERILQALCSKTQ